jgi:hypothetical protein
VSITQLGTCNKFVQSRLPAAAFRDPGPQHSPAPDSQHVPKYPLLLYAVLLLTFAPLAKMLRPSCAARLSWIISLGQQAGDGQNTEVRQTTHIVSTSSLRTCCNACCPYNSTHLQWRMQPCFHGHQCKQPAAEQHLLGWNRATCASAAASRYAIWKLNSA